MKRFAIPFLLSPFIISCGGKPPEQAPVQQKAEANQNVPEVTTKELETLGETFTGKRVVLKGAFSGLTSAYMGTLFDKSFEFGFTVRDKKGNTFLYNVASKELFAKALLKSDDWLQISVYGVVKNIDNKFWIMVDAIQGLSPEGKADVDQGIAKQNKAKEEADVAEKAWLAKNQKDNKAKKGGDYVGNRMGGNADWPRRSSIVMTPEEVEAMRIQQAKAKKEFDAMQEKRFAMQAKEAGLAQALKPLYEARKDLIQEFPVPGQNGKKVSQILSDLKIAMRATNNRFQIETIQTSIRQYEDILASLGVAKAAQTIMEVQDKLAQVDGADINPTLPNWGMQNGRTTFKSVATKKMIKAEFQKDLAALKKYKERIEDLDKQIADVQK